MFISVDLPDPDEPINTAYSLCSISRSIESTALMTCWPIA